MIMRSGILNGISVYHHALKIARIHVQYPVMLNCVPCTWIYAIMVMWMPLQPPMVCAALLCDIYSKPYPILCDPTHTTGMAQGRDRARSRARNTCLCFQLTNFHPFRSENGPWPRVRHHKQPWEKIIFGGPTSSVW